MAESLGNSGSSGDTTVDIIGTELVGPVKDTYLGTRLLVVDGLCFFKSSGESCIERVAVDIEC